MQHGNRTGARLTGDIATAAAELHNVATVTAKKVHDAE